MSQEGTPKVQSLVLDIDWDSEFDSVIYNSEVIKKYKGSGSTIISPDRYRKYHSKVVNRNLDNTILDY